VGIVPLGCSITSTLPSKYRKNSKELWLMKWWQRWLVNVGTNASQVHLGISSVPVKLIALHTVHNVTWRWACLSWNGFRVCNEDQWPSTCFLNKHSLKYLAANFGFFLYFVETLLSEYLVYFSAMIHLWLITYSLFDWRVEL
jgi:hypothetical protein